MRDGAVAFGGSGLFLAVVAGVGTGSGPPFVALLLIFVVLAVGALAVLGFRSRGFVLVWAAAVLIRGARGRVTDV